jgi:hypothetical protein
VFAFSYIWLRAHQEIFPPNAGSLPRIVGTK